MANLIVEDPYVDKWIYQQLSGDTTITSSFVGTNIFRSHVVPQEDGVILIPCIKFFKVQMGFDRTTMNATRVMNYLYYQVETISRADSIQGNMRTVANRVDTLLHRTRGTGLPVTIDGACVILSSDRVQTISRQVIDENVAYQFIGGTYKIGAQAA